jgi:hypothetical protein
VIDVERERERERERSCSRKKKRKKKKAFLLIYITYGPLKLLISIKKKRSYTHQI